MRLAVELSRRFGKPISEVWAETSEVEMRLHQVYAAQEPDIEGRFDYWLGSLLTAYLNAHRKKDATPIKIKDVTPKWGWHGKSESDEAEKMKSATNALLAWAQAMSKRPADQPKRKRK